MRRGGGAKEGGYGLCDGSGGGCECEGVDFDGVEGGGRGASSVGDGASGSVDDD